MRKKQYLNEEITITWNPQKCTHSGNCVRGTPDVFKPKERPWVKIDAASSEEIMKTIDTCPSGALSYQKNKS
ncbi:MAG: (4Fe-4S)-binding protein [Bacteroidota bacterium]